MQGRRPITAADENRKSKLKSRLIFVAKIAVSVLLIGYLFRETNPADIGKRIAGAELSYLLAALAVIAVITPLLGLRWFLVLKSVGAPLPLRAAVPISYIGMFFGQFLPAAVGSDAIRGWFAYRNGIGIRAAVTSLLVDRIFGLLALAFLILASMPVLSDLTNSEVTFAAFAGSAGIVGATIAGLLVASIPPSFFTRPRILVSLFEFARGVRPGLWSGTAIGTLSVSVSMHLIYISAAVLIARALGVSLSYLEALAVVAIVTLISNLPISFNGWGVREGAMVIGMGYLGVGQGDALTISILLGLLMAVSVLPGLPVWVVMRTAQPAPGADKATPNAEAG